MKRLLLFIDNLGAGGAQRQFVGLARMLKKKGYTIKVITYFHATFYESQLIESGVEYENIFKANVKLYRLPLVNRKIKEFKPDIVVSFLDTPCIVSCIVKKVNRNFKLVVSERNTTQRLTIKERIKFFLYRYADSIVTNSFSQKEFIKIYYPHLLQKTIAIPNFVDLNYFKYVGNRELSTARNILVVSSIWESKNTLGFIEAVKELKDKGCDFSVQWYGKPNTRTDYYQECVDRIKKYHIEKFIHLMDKTQNIRQAYFDADYFCLPSFYEGTPNVLCEAISCGLPVACSNVCDNSRFAEENINGFLFNPNNSSEISNCLIKLLNLSKEEYAGFSNRSRKIALRKLSPEVFIESYLKVLKQLDDKDF